MIVFFDGGDNYYIEVLVEFFFKLIEEGFIEVFFNIKNLE